MFAKYKKGFTLAEILITIAVIAVVAAILLPLANRFKPDTIKIKYLKTYDAITDVVSRLARNQELFNGIYVDPATGTYNIQKIPFLMKSEDFTDNFAEGMNALNTPQSNGTQEQANLNFTTKDGTAWTLATSSRINLAQGTGTFLSDLQIWLDGDRNNNAATNHFQFYITADGQTHVGDEQGMTYLDTRGNLMQGNHNIPNPNNPPVIPDPDIICEINLRDENEDAYEQGTSGSTNNNDDSSSASSSSSGTTNEESASSASSSSGTTNEESASSASSSSGTTNEESASSSDNRDDDWQSSAPDQSDGYWDYDPGDDWW